MAAALNCSLRHERSRVDQRRSQERLLDCSMTPFLALQAILGVIETDHLKVFGVGSVDTSA